MGGGGWSLGVCLMSVQASAVPSLPRDSETGGARAELWFRSRADLPASTGFSTRPRGDPGKPQAPQGHMSKIGVILGSASEDAARAI